MGKKGAKRETERRKSGGDYGGPTKREGDLREYGETVIFAKYLFFFYTRYCSAHDRSSIKMDEEKYIRDLQKNELLLSYSDTEQIGHNAGPSMYVRTASYVVHCLH